MMIARGRIRIVPGTGPAAGADISSPVPNGVIWWLKGALFTLTTSAAAGSRVVHVRIFDGSLRIRWWASVNSQGPSTTRGYRLLPYGYQPALYSGSLGSIDFIAMDTSPLLMLPGWIFETATEGLDAGDQYSAPSFEVEEWGA